VRPARLTRGPLLATPLYSTSSSPTSPPVAWPYGAGIADNPFWTGIIFSSPSGPSSFRHLCPKPHGFDWDDAVPPDHEPRPPAGHVRDRAAMISLRGPDELVRRICSASPA
jgi:hypothetical protein